MFYVSAFCTDRSSLGRQNRRTERHWVRRSDDIGEPMVQEKRFMLGTAVRCDTTHVLTATRKPVCPREVSSVEAERAEVRYR